MGYFTLWVLSLVLVFVNFRAFTIYRINTFQAIVVNYLVCAVTGSIMNGSVPQPKLSAENMPWLIIALVLGVIFISTFYVIALSTQRAGVAATSLAGRVSFVVPALFSLFVWETSSKVFDVWNYSGILLTLPALILSAYKPKKEEAPGQSALGKSRLWLPVAVFVISGAIDSMMNYTNIRFLNEEQESTFTVLLFFISGLTGICILLFKFLFRKEKLDLRSMLAGVLLGVPNYFSVYLMLVVLRIFDNDGAFVFTIFNIAIIVSAALVSKVLFKEHLNRSNYLGIILALVSVLLISYQEILG